MTIPAKQRSEILRAQTYKGMTHDDFVRLVTELAEIDGAAIILGISGCLDFFIFSLSLVNSGQDA